MKISDGEFFKDCTVIVFKEQGKKEYDVFVGCNIDFSTLKIPKTNIYHLKDLKSYIITNKINFVGYNNQYFDNQIYQKIINGMIIPEDIYNYSQGIINSKDKFHRDFYDNNLDFQYLDLLKINHYDNPARMTSLKKLEFNYRRKKILDLPFHHSQLVTKLSELEDTIRYCMEDVDTTEECYNYSLEAIKFRQDLSEKFNRPDFMNYSDGKIGEEINLIYYCEKTGENPNVVKREKPSYPNILINFKDCIPDYIKFKTSELDNLLNSVKSKTVTSTKGFKEQIELDGLIYTLGQGGIHSENLPAIYRSNEEYIIKDADINGMYPAEMIKRKLHPRHLSPVWASNLEQRYDERVNQYKPIAHKDPTAKMMSDVIKAILNISYGKTNSEFSWQYDPFVTMQTTLGGQFTLLMLVEKFILNNIKIISINTDGITVMLKRSNIDLYHRLCEEWILEVGSVKVGGLEFVDYDFIAFTSVNDYIAKTSKGKIKRKGSFMTYEDIKANNWHKDSSGMIISLALQEYYINNIPVENTINNCNNIFEFCYGTKKQKAPKQGDFKWLISEVGDTGIVTNSLSEDRFIRYYIGGTTTINKLYENGLIKNLSTKGEPVTVAQYIRREEIIKDGINMYKNLNKQFYINEANNIIKLINNEI